MEHAERELVAQLSYLSRAIDLREGGPVKALKYTVEEEQAIEDRLNDAVLVYRKQFQEAEDVVQEIADAHEAAKLREKIEHAKVVMKGHVISVRKILVSYRQRAKAERLQHARTSIMHNARSATDKKIGASNTSIDTMAALKRTRRIMSEEIQRVGTISKVLDDGRLSLKSSHNEYDGVNAEIAEVQKRLQALKWQAQQDRMWIASGVAILASTVIYIVHQRTGFLIM